MILSCNGTSQHINITDQTIQFAEVQNVNNDVCNFSMQKWLIKLSAILARTEPNFTHHDITMHGGMPVYRYYVSLDTALIGRPPVSIG